MSQRQDKIKELSDADWFQALEAIGEEKGYFQRLGEQHSVLFAEETPKLLVSFETVENARQLSDDGLPRALGLLPEWSHLVLLSDGRTWFRDPAVIGYFDRLIDEGLFEDFDQVVFIGAGAAGYAAASYSVAAPGAHVIAIEPQATLDPRLTGWDMRFRAERRRDFTHRFGFAPEMLEAAAAATILFDPTCEDDAMHAALFARPNTKLKHLPHLMGYLEPAMADMGILAPMIEHAGAGTLDDATLGQLLRERRQHLPYLRNLLAARDCPGREKSSTAICRHTLARFDAPRIEKRMQALNAVARTKSAPKDALPIHA